MGTRLRPLTDRMPKALVPVAGVPLLQRVILKLKDAGVDEMVINIHHLGQQIIDFLQANGNFGLDIHISDERALLLDTGGGILWIPAGASSTPAPSWTGTSLSWCTTPTS